MQLGDVIAISGIRAALAAGPEITASLGHFVAGPFCTRLLADLGADVIKVEPPGGDPVRQWGRKVEGAGAPWFSMHGRNKRLITINLKSPRAVAIVLDLVKTCDALVESFRPGQLARMGLSRDKLEAARPGLVVAQISGYGQDGAYRDRAAFGVIGEAIGGLRYLTNHPASVSNLPPVRVGVSIGDSLAGLYAAFGIMAALWARDRKKGGDGRSRTLDVALTESVLSIMEGMLPEYGVFGSVRQPTGSRIPTAAPSSAYPTSDGGWILIAGNSEPIFQRLVGLMGQPGLANEPRFIGNAARVANVDEIDRLIGAWTINYTAAELDRMLAEADIPATLTYTAAEIAADAPWYSGLTARHWRILWGSYLGWIFDGYEAVALVYALRPALNSILTPEQAQTPSFYVGVAIGITLLGWGIGGLMGGVAAHYIGRKRMMMYSILGYAIFTGMTAFAGNFLQLVILRFIMGLAIGSEWSTGIALVAETWPNKARPKGCSFLQSGFGGGAILAAIIWLILSATNPLGNESWRIMFALGALPAFVCLYLRRALEESEQWAIALKEQRWAATLEDAQSGAAHKPAERPFTLTEILREPESRRRVLLATAMSFATTVGWWAVSSWLPTYTETLAKLAGEPADVWGPRMGVIYNVGAITAYLLSGFVADGIGRRRFLFVTYVGCIISSVVAYTWTGSLPIFMAIAFLNGFFTLGFAFSWMAIYLVELFTASVRATAASFVFNGARLIAWVFPIIAGHIVTSLGGVAPAALIMSSVYAIGLIVPWFMPETTGKPLPE